MTRIPILKATDTAVTASGSKSITWWQQLTAAAAKAPVHKPSTCVWRLDSAEVSDLLHGGFSLYTNHVEGRLPTLCTRQDGIMK